MILKPDNRLQPADDSAGIPGTEPKPSNPDTGKPATPETLTGASAPVDADVATKIAGKDLVPDFSPKGSLGVLAEYSFWVGVMPSCPVEGIALAGIQFPKINENIIPATNRSGRTERVPVIGAIVQLTEVKIKMMCNRLPRLVIRFKNEPAVREEPGTGLNLGDVHLQGRKGRIITIPTKEEVADRQKRGRATKHYTPDTRDEPAARYMFCVLCKNQDHPERGDTYPGSIEDLGLEWPDTIEE